MSACSVVGDIVHTPADPCTDYMLTRIETKREFERGMWVIRTRSYVRVHHHAIGCVGPEIEAKPYEYR